MQTYEKDFVAWANEQARLRLSGRFSGHGLNRYKKSTPKGAYWLTVGKITDSTG